MNDQERYDTRLAALYELRLIFTSDKKQSYTTDEIVELLDELALALANEQEA